MVKANFEYEGNIGLLKVITHFDQIVEVSCKKEADEIFRLGGTAVNETLCYEGILLELNKNPLFKAFKTMNLSFEDRGVLSPENWNDSDLHCYITEYYPIDMEGKKPGWFLSKKPISNANHLFINLDVLDGGGNIIKRYRVSPFTGEYRLMENLNG